MTVGDCLIVWPSTCSAVQFGSQCSPLDFTLSKRSLHVRALLHAFRLRFVLIINFLFAPFCASYEQLCVSPCCFGDLFSLVVVHDCTAIRRTLAFPPSATLGLSDCSYVFSASVIVCGSGAICAQSKVCLYRVISWFEDSCLCVSGAVSALHQFERHMLGGPWGFGASRNVLPFPSAFTSISNVAIAQYYRRYWSSPGGRCHTCFPAAAVFPPSGMCSIVCPHWTRPSVDLRLLPALLVSPCPGLFDPAPGTAARDANGKGIRNCCFKCGGGSAPGSSNHHLAKDCHATAAQVLDWVQNMKPVQ